MEVEILMMLLVTAKVCRTTPTRNRVLTSNTTIVNDRAETVCLIPYSFDGTKYTECLVSGIEGFTLPVFRCPIRTIKDRGTDYFREALKTKKFFNGLGLPDLKYLVALFETY